MLKSMGKKKLLTLVAVMAVAVTVMGSFAVWDQLTATNTKEVTLRSQTTIIQKSLELTADPTVLGTAPVYKGTATYTVANLPDTATLSIDTANAVVKDGVTTVPASKYTLTAEAVNKTGITGGNGDITSAITLTFDDESQDLAGKTLTIELPAKIGNPAP